MSSRTDDDRRSLLETDVGLRKVMLYVPDAVYLAREGGLLVEVNDMACAMLALSRAELLLATVFDLDPDLTVTEAADLWCRASRGPLPTIERRLVRRGGTRVPVELRLSRIEIDGAPYMLGIARDLSERKRTEEALRESEANFRRVYENLVDVFYRTDRHGIIRMISPSVERYGHKTGDLIGKHVSQFSEVLGEYEQLLARLVEYHSVDDFEITLKRGDGSPVRASASARLLRDDEGRPSGMEGLLRDITERKQSEAALQETVAVLNLEISERRKVEAELKDSRAQLRALSSRLLSVAEEERRRISREIHDELGQMLSALTMDLAWLSQKLDGDSSRAPLGEKVHKMERQVDGMIESVQTIATKLRPSMLDDIGLAAAIEWLVREFRERTRIQCRLTLDDEDLGLDSERSTAVFRLIQEALTNVSRHAAASEVDVNLERSGFGLSIEIRDNGRGIRREEVENPSSLGLVGMRERVHRWGGRMEVEGAPGQGTLLRFMIPLAITKEYA